MTSKRNNDIAAELGELERAIGKIEWALSVLEDPDTRLSEYELGEEEADTICERMYKDLEQLQMKLAQQLFTISVTETEGIEAVTIGPIASMVVRIEPEEAESQPMRLVRDARGNIGLRSDIQVDKYARLVALGRIKPWERRGQKRPWDSLIEEMGRIKPWVRLTEQIGEEGDDQELGGEGIPSGRG